MKERIFEILNRAETVNGGKLEGEAQYAYLAGYYSSCLDQIAQILKEN